MVTGCTMLVEVGHGTTRTGGPSRLRSTFFEFRESVLYNVMSAKRNTGWKDLPDRMLYH